MDASVVVDLVLARLPPATVDRIFDSSPELHVPRLLDLEVMQALRGMVGRGAASEAAAQAGWLQLDFLDLRWHGHEAFRARIWSLRHVLTAYDAVYLALAEARACPLFTRDRGLARCPLARTAVELV